MKAIFILILAFIFNSSLVSAQQNRITVLKTATGELEGTLISPDKNVSRTVALLIAGSGPTDRDGNNQGMTNNSLKMLAEGLSQSGIASVRYDKRGIGKSRSAGLQESDLRFENYINDAAAWCNYLKNGLKFKKVIIIGHSEGALIGMIAAQGKNVDQYISIAGAGQAADKILREQLKNQPPLLSMTINSILDNLVKGKLVEQTPPELNALFRKSVQPYMISWFKYDPQKEITKLKIPVLILQGTTDIQVGTADAQRLSKALPKAKLKLIEGMNHIFKSAPIDRNLNIATYTNPTLPIHKELMEQITLFIKQ